MTKDTQLARDKIVVTLVSWIVKVLFLRGGSVERSRKYHPGISLKTYHLLEERKLST